MAHRYHDDAVRRGVRLVPACGFASVPPDLGCLLLVHHLLSRWGRCALGQPCWV